MIKDQSCQQIAVLSIIIQKSRNFKINHEFTWHSPPRSSRSEFKAKILCFNHEIKPNEFQIWVAEIKGKAINNPDSGNSQGSGAVTRVKNKRFVNQKSISSLKGEDFVNLQDSQLIVISQKSTKFQIAQIEIRERFVRTKFSKLFRDFQKLGQKSHALIQAYKQNHHLNTISLHQNLHINTFPNQPHSNSGRDRRRSSASSSATTHTLTHTCLYRYKKMLQNYEILVE